MIHLGDWRELDLTGVDHVITDPPYGESTHGGHLSLTTLRDGSPAGQALGFEGVTGEEIVDMARTWCEAVPGWAVFTCEWLYMHKLHEAGLLVRFGLWRKPNGAPQFTGDRPGMGWEALAICHGAGRARGGDHRKVWNGGGKHGVWDVPKEVGTEHPTQKPVRLYEQLVADFTQPGDLVCDPFSGSGTTGVACMNLGRRFLGAERDPRWHALATARIDAAASQGRLFA